MCLLRCKAVAILWWKKARGLSLTWRTSRLHFKCREDSKYWRSATRIDEGRRRCPQCCFRQDSRGKRRPPNQDRQTKLQLLGQDIQADVHALQVHVQVIEGSLNAQAREVLESGEKAQTPRNLRSTKKLRRRLEGAAGGQGCLRCQAPRIRSAKTSKERVATSFSSPTLWQPALTLLLERRKRTMTRTRRSR